MNEEYEVEIDGALFTVRRVSAMERIMAAKDSEILTEELGEEEAELIARACILAKSLFADNKPVFDSGRDALEKLTYEKVYELTKHEVFYEKVTEKYVERQLETLRESAGEDDSYSLPQSVLSDFKNYRRQVEELSRYLERDSRRYDGNFDLY